MSDADAPPQPSLRPAAGTHRFLLRWPSRYKLVDVRGMLKDAYRFSVGKKATSSKVVRDMVRSASYRRSLIWQPCLHPDYNCPFTLVICRPGKKGCQPWYLLINEEVKSEHDAWRLCLPTPEGGRSSRPSASTKQRWAWSPADSGSGRSA
ncbi:MAG TPA: hypothetical protein VIG72_00980 [Pontibacter sp.]